MSAEVLPAAARLMRERAEAARYWQFENGEARLLVWHVASELAGDPFDPAHAEHIASWHPAVALAVADLLDVVGAWVEEFGALPVDGEMEIVGRRTLAVARAYLGESA